MVDKIVEENIETIIEMTVMTETGTGLEKGHFLEIMATIENRSTSNSRSRSGSRASTNRDRIRCYKYREYDHQQMLHLRDEKTSLVPSMSNMQGNLSRTGSEESQRTGHLNL